MEQAPKTYKVHIYAQAPGPEAYTGNLMSFSLDSYVTNGLVLTYPGASRSVSGFIYSREAKMIHFLTNQGKSVFTNLPVIIEEE